MFQSQRSGNFHAKIFIFEGSSYDEISCVFIIEHIEGHSLLQCALSTGMDYKHTAVDWASYKLGRCSVNIP